MTLFGLIDWIIISLIGLAISFIVVCLMLMTLHGLFMFKPKVHYRPSTKFDDKEGNVRIVEAPNLYYQNYYRRMNRLKWYHQLIITMP